jgi:hypothetical protein
MDRDAARTACHAVTRPDPRDAPASLEQRPRKIEVARVLARGAARERAQSLLVSALRERPVEQRGLRRGYAQRQRLEHRRAAPAVQPGARSIAVGKFLVGRAPVEFRPGGLDIAAQFAAELGALRPPLLLEPESHVRKGAEYRAQAPGLGRHGRFQE